MDLPGPLYRPNLNQIKDVQPNSINMKEEQIPSTSTAQAGVSADNALRFWVLHFEKDRRYGPFFSFGTAQGVMNRKQREFPDDTFDIEEEEFAHALQLAGLVQEVDLGEEEEAGIAGGPPNLITVRCFFSAQGNGSFQAGKFNTGNGDASGWFPARSPIRLSAKAAPGHIFSHWTFNGNFGGSEATRTVPARIGLRIVGVFVRS